MIMQNDETVHERRKKKNKRLLTIGLVAAIGMFGFGFALVPLYNVLCNVLGINGKTGAQVTYDATKGYIDKQRWITIEFLATNNQELPWKFYPIKKKLKVHPGQVYRMAYFAENNSGRTMTVQAIPSVAPGYAAKYLKKTECFCFSQQTFKNGEKQEMPLMFHLDPAIPKSVHTLSLSYTMFDAGKYKQQKQKGRIRS